LFDGESESVGYGELSSPAGRKRRFVGIRDKEWLNEYARHLARA
jgi:hypothetical protein